jgi:hypothetical protein
MNLAVSCIFNLIGALGAGMISILIVRVFVSYTAYHIENTFSKYYIRDRDD